MYNREHTKLTPVLLELTYWEKNSIFTNKHDKFINPITYKVSNSTQYKNGHIIYIESIKEIDSHKGKTYFTNDLPIWTIDFISEVSNNKRIDGEDIIESIIESISDYSGDCGLSRLVKDVEKLFDKNWSSKYGCETRKFIALFSEWSYYDSYAGDGDYSIEYEKIFNLEL